MIARPWPALFFILLFQAAGCDSFSSSTAYQPEITDRPAAGIAQEYKVSVVPEGSQKRVTEIYGPLVDYLNARLDGVKLVLVAPKDHLDFEAGLLAREFALAVTNAFQTVKSIAYGYRVVAKKADDDGFYGILLVRRDSGIDRVKDLKGKRVSYPTPNGVAATILPMVFLQEHGIDVFHDIENLYVGSHESSILHVYQGKSAAGAAREFSWAAFQKAHPEKARELEVKWRTEPLMDHAVIAHPDIPQVLIDRVVQLLVSLDDTPEGQSILSAMGTTRFEPASDAVYARAREFFLAHEDLMPSPLYSPATGMPHVDQH